MQAWHTVWEWFLTLSLHRPPSSGSDTSPAGHGEPLGDAGSHCNASLPWSYRAALGVPSGKHGGVVIDFSGFTLQVIPFWAPVLRELPQLEET